MVSEEVKGEEEVRVEFAEEVGQEFQEKEEESEEGESKMQKFFRKIGLNQNEIDQFLDNGYDSDESIWDIHAETIELFSLRVIVMQRLLDFSKFRDLHYEYGDENIFSISLKEIRIWKQTQAINNQGTTLKEQVGLQTPGPLTTTQSRLEHPDDAILRRRESEQQLATNKAVQNALNRIA